VVVLVLGTGFWLSRSGGPSPVTTPDQQDDVVQPTMDDFEFAEVPADSKRMLGDAFQWPPGILSNGSVFVTGLWDDHDTYAVSSDGVSWSAGGGKVVPFYAGPGEFVGITSDVGEFLGPLSSTRLWRSSDGLSWSEADPVEEAWRLATFRYFGLSVDEVLSLSLSLPGAWGQGGPAGAILKLGDTYVAYYFSEAYWNGLLDLDGDEFYLNAALSDDGRTWSSVAPQDFLLEWFHGARRTFWDGGASDLTWSWTFAVRGDRAMALTGDLDRRILWESADGLSWETVTTSYLEEPAFDVFEADIGGLLPSQAISGLPGPAPTHRVAALDDGWAILERGIYHGTGSSTTRGGALFSVDGRNWLPLESGWGSAAAGDKTFLLNSGLVVATYTASNVGS
jgi:hypothetical protein